MLSLKASGAFEIIWIWCILITALLALVYALVFYHRIAKKDKQDRHIQELSDDIKMSTAIYWYNQLKVILPTMIVLMIAMFIYVVIIPIPKEVMEYFSGYTEDQVKIFVGVGSSIAFIIGSLSSIIISEFGMRVAIKGRIRVVSAANRGFRDALNLAYSSGAITGIIGDGLGLLGGMLIIIIFGKASPQVFIGLGLGATLIAIFMRVGGGVYPKIADYTAVAVDIFQSYEITMISSLVLGLALEHTINDYRWIVFPFMLRGIGIISSIIGTYIVGARKDKDLNAMRSISYGFYISIAINLMSSIIISYFYMKDWTAFLSMIIGITLVIALNKVTKYFTDVRNKPTNDIAKLSQDGEDTLIIKGIISGFEVSAWKILIITFGLLAVILIYLDKPTVNFFYGISMLATGMLMFTSNNISMYSFGTICGDYNDMKEVCSFDENCRRILQRLDAAGNTAKSVAKTASIESAIFASIALIGAFLIMVSKVQLQQGVRKKAILLQSGIHISDPKVLAATLIGISITLLLTSFIIKMVSRVLTMMWRELAKPFCIPIHMNDWCKNSYERKIDNYMLWAHKQMAALALIALLGMLMIGIVLGVEPLGGFLLGGLFSAQLLIMFISSSGSQWHSAKKNMEYGLNDKSILQKHKALMIADRVGNPLQKGSWSTLNTMNKSISFMGLLMAPILVVYCKVTMGTIIISCICLVLIVAAIVYCKSDTSINNIS